MRIKWFSLIRITGLLFVLLYHFFQTIFPGGFFGVDVFFTFSGFLITALLIEEFSKIMKIDLVGFFRRRFYRYRATCGFDGLGDHALYLLSSTRLCSWNWWPDCGCFRLHDQLLWAPHRWELWISVSFHICLFIIGAWPLRFTTIFFGDWQFGSYPNSPNQMVSWGEWFFSYQLLPSWSASSPCLLVVF